jgi:hypothetical protein
MRYAVSATSLSTLGWATQALGPLSFRAAAYSGVFALLPMLTGEARRLHVEKRILIQCIVRRSVLQPDLVETDLQLLSKQHSERGVGALAHLDHWHHQRHRSLAIDADEGVWSEARRRLGRRPSGAKRGRQGNGESKAASKGGASLEKAAAVESVRQRVVKHDRLLARSADADMIWPDWQ